MLDAFANPGGKAVSAEFAVLKRRLSERFAQIGYRVSRERQRASQPAVAVHDVDEIAPPHQ
jgi:hypothetical protein